jgi:hypothetical protein
MTRGRVPRPSRQRSYSVCPLECWVEKSATEAGRKGGGVYISIGAILLIILIVLLIIFVF